MFSSVSSIFGNPAQGNYGAANAFLDSLAHHRRALGLPALTINWGVLGGEGYVARNERVAEFLARQGTAELSPGEVMSILEASLARRQHAGHRPSASTGPSGGNSSAECRKIRCWSASSPRSKARKASGVTGDWRAGSTSASAEDRESVIAACRPRRRRLRAAGETRHAAQRSAAHRSRARFAHGRGDRKLRSRAAIGVALPPTSLMRARTIGQIATLIAGHLGGGSCSRRPRPQRLPPLPKPRQPKKSIWTLSQMTISNACSAATPLRRSRRAQSEPARSRRMSDRQSARLSTGWRAEKPACSRSPFPSANSGRLPPCRSRIRESHLLPHQDAQGITRRRRYGRRPARGRAAGSSAPFFSSG